HSAAPHDREHGSFPSHSTWSGPPSTPPSRSSNPTRPHPASIASAAPHATIRALLLPTADELAPRRSASIATDLPPHGSAIAPSGARVRKPEEGSPDDDQQAGAGERAREKRCGRPW